MNWKEAEDKVEHLEIRVKEEWMVRAESHALLHVYFTIPTSGGRSTSCSLSVILMLMLVLMFR